jgi:plastocyanin
VGGALTPAGSGGAASPTPASSTATPAAGGGAGGSTTTGAGSTGTGAGGETSSTETSTAPARVQVIAKEYSFTLSRAEVPAGKVIVEFIDGGEDPHNLHLAEPAEGTEAGSFPTSEPGTHADLTLNMHPGTYTLFCSLPGHEAKGMKATLTVN